MTAKELAGEETGLDGFLGGLLAGLGRSKRKSIEPMAGRVPGADEELRQFMGRSPCAVEAIQRGLTEQIVDTLTKPEVWMISETSFPWRAARRWGRSAILRALGNVAN